MNTNFFSDSLDPEEKARLDRQLRLPGWNQAALKASTVIICGVGGLGTEIAKNLAMAGVGTIWLVDMDTIEHYNLNRQILFSDANEGSPKARVAAEALKKINPHSKYMWYHGALEDMDPIIYQQADLLISGLDSVDARRELNRRAVQLGKPLIDGGTTTYYGHTYTYNLTNACLACDPMTEPEKESLAACTLVGTPRKYSHCLLKGQLYFESENGRPPSTSNKQEMQIVLDYANKLVKEHFPHKEPFTLDRVVQLVDEHEPTVITINAVVASLQSQEAVKVLHHAKGIKLGTVNEEYVIYNGLIGKFFYLEKPKNPKCMMCGPNALAIEELTLPRSTTLDMLLYLIKKKGYEFDETNKPSYYRMDAKDMEEVPRGLTLAEARIRHGETLYVIGLHKDGKEADIYLRVYIKEQR